MDGSSGAELGITIGSDARVDTSGFSEPGKKLTTEAPKEEVEQPSKFSEETKEKLSQKGCIFFDLEEFAPKDRENPSNELTGNEVKHIDPNKTLQEIINRTCRGFLDTHELGEVLKEMKLRSGEVALLPEIYLEGGEEKTYIENLQQMKQLEEMFRKGYPGATIVMARISDILKIQAIREAQAAERGGPVVGYFGDALVRTGSFVSGGKNIVFANGEVVDRWDPNLKDELLRVVPLVIPSE